ncbi:MAG TPA: hypothetical protein VLG92_04710 [Candidatus Saccharimonadia bacterium]|nr:hypothetical protein [Candidatus Saccharimonadia bacterium]
MSEHFPHFDQDPVAPEQQGPPPRVFLEVGVGASMGYSWIADPFREGDVYIGIDNGMANNERFGWSDNDQLYVNLLSAQKPNKAQQYFMAADGRQLPLCGGCVDEVLFKDVFSDPLLAPLIPSKDYTAETDVTLVHTPSGEKLEIAEGMGRIAKPHFIIDELGEARGALLQEAARVTKHGGRVVIHSFTTPLVVNHVALAQWFTSHNFDPILYEAGCSEWNEVARQYYDWDPATTLYDQRLLIAVKR